MCVVDQKTDKVLAYEWFNPWVESEDDYELAYEVIQGQRTLGDAKRTSQQWADHTAENELTLMVESGFGDEALAKVGF